MKTTQRNNETIHDDFDYSDNNINRQNNESIHLRDQLKKLISEYFIQSSKDERQIFSNVSSLIENKKLEKIQSMENQIVEEEKRILELEKAKEQKLIKVIFAII